jgi:hypothetical protein
MKHSHNSPAESAKHDAPASVQPVESEHGHLAGKKHSGQHEVLENNVETGQQERHPATPAGQHATGSFTGTAKHPRRG